MADPDQLKRAIEAAVRDNPAGVTDILAAALLAMGNAGGAAEPSDAVNATTASCGVPDVAATNHSGSSSNLAEEPASPDRHKRRRGCGAEYTPVDDRVFDTESGAEENLAKQSGLDPGDGAMICNNAYKRKARTAALVGTKRFRCPYARRRGWKPCGFTMMIRCHPHGFRVYRNRAQHKHVRLSVKEVKPEFSDRAKRTIEDMTMGGAPPKAISRRLRELDLIPSGLTTQQVKSRINNMRQRCWKKSAERPAPGPSLLEIEAFCRARQGPPANDLEPICLAFSASHLNQDGECYGYFTCEALLRAGHSCPAISADFTHKLSYAPYPVLVLGGVFPGNPPRFRLLLVGYSLRETAHSIEVAMVALRNKMKELHLRYDPRTFIGDSAEPLTLGFRKAHGDTLPIGLTQELRWPSVDSAADLHARIFCYVHMWRGILQKGMPRLRADLANKEDYDRARIAFRQALTILQTAPSGRHFETCAKLLTEHWSEVSPGLVQYLKDEWLFSRGSWGQYVYEEYSIDSLLPRHSNSAEQVNSVLKSGAVRLNMSLSSLISELLAFTKDTAFADMNSGTPGPNVDPDPLAPTTDQLLAAARWCRSIKATNVYRDVESLAYYVPSASCLRIHGEGELLDEAMGIFYEKYHSHEGWLDFPDYSRSLRQIRVIKRNAGGYFRCSCVDSARHVHCRHSLGAMLMEHRLESTAIACIRDLDAPGAAPRGCVQYPRSGALVINPSYARRHADLIQSFGPRGERGPPLPAKARVIAAVSRYDADASSILRDVSDDILDDESSGDESDIRRVFDKTMIERVEAEVEEEERQAAAGASLMSSARESMSSESGGGSDGTSTETEESENSEFMRECEKSEERGPCDNSSSESDESESSEFIHESEISEEGSGCDNSSSESEGLLLEASAGSDSELEPDLEEGAAMGSRDTCHSIPDLGRKNIAVADKSYQSSPVPARSFDVHYCDADLGDGGNGAASIDVSPIEAAAISSPLIPTSNLWSPEQSPAPSVIHELSHANCSTEPWRPANLLMPRRSERIRKRPRIDYQMMHRRGLPR